MRHSVLALSLVLAAPAFAQTANPHDIGFIASADSKSVGACAEFSCTPRTLDMNTVPGTSLMLSVFGGNKVPYFIAASTMTANCISVPGMHNSFALHPGTTVILAVGTLERDGVGTCGRSAGSISIAVPKNVPAGATVALQALSFFSADAALPSFSRPIVVTAAPETTR